MMLHLPIIANNGLFEPVLKQDEVEELESN